MEKINLETVIEELEMWERIVKRNDRKSDYIKAYRDGQQYVIGQLLETFRAYREEE